MNASTVQISHSACRATAWCWSTSSSVPMLSAFSPALSASTRSFELPWEARSRRCSQLSLRILLLSAALLSRCLNCALLSRCLTCAHHGLCPRLQRTAGVAERDSRVLEFPSQNFIYRPRSVGGKWNITEMSHYIQEAFASKYEN